MKILVTESQLNKCILLEQRMCDIFTTHTTSQDYDDVLRGLDDRFQRALEGKIVQMTPDEYFNRCAELQGNTKQDQYKLLDKSKVTMFAERMSKGEKFNLPYIDYQGKQQEGRHRVAAAELHGCNMVSIGVFKEEGRDDPYNEDWDKDRDYTLKDLERSLIDVHIDHNDVFVEYIHDWEHPRDVEMFLDLYPKFEGKWDLFYNRMTGIKSMPEYTNEFDFNTDTFIFDEDPKELTTYIWEQIKSHTNEDQLYEVGYKKGDKLDFQDVLKILANVANIYEVLSHLHNSVKRMLNAVFVYTFYKNNWKYFQTVGDKYRVEFGSGIIKVYSSDKYRLDSTMGSGKELLRGLRVQLSNADPIFAEFRGQYILSISDIESHLKKYPIK